MPTLIDQLRMDPDYRLLSVKDQMDLAKVMANEFLSKDPDYQALNPAVQRRMLDMYAAEAPTFNDPGTEQSVKSFSQDYLAGGAGVEKGTREFFDNFVANSGVVGFVDRMLPGGAERTLDRKRAIDYYRQLDTLAGRADAASELGSVTGVITDVVVTNALMSPIVNAGKMAIGAAARGVSAAEYAASVKAIEEAHTAIRAARAAKIGTEVAQAAYVEATRAAPAILNRTLATLGPVAAESLIEAVPFYLVEDERRLQQGMPSVSSQGAGEIAKTLGMNAALDFAINTAIGAALNWSFKTGSAIFRKSEIYKEISDTGINSDQLLRQVEMGVSDPAIAMQLSEIDQAQVAQRVAITHHVRDFIADPEADAWGRLSYLAHDAGGRVVSKTVDEATGAAAFHLYEFDDAGKAIKRTYKSMTDIEDGLSYRYFKSNMDAAGELLSKEGNEGKTLLDAMAESTNPAHRWALARGERLVSQAEIFDGSVAGEIDPELGDLLKGTPKRYQNPLNRPIISKNEAAALADKPGVFIQKTSVPLKGSVVEALDNGEMDFLRGQSPIVANPQGEANAILVGTREAPMEAYLEATQKAAKLVDDDTYKTVEEARASLLMSRGYDFIRKPDGTAEFFTGRNARLLGSAEDVASIPDILKVRVKAPEALTMNKSFALPSFLKKDDTWSPMVIEKLGGKLNIVDGNYQVELNGAVREFSDFDEFTTYVARKTADEARVRTDLAIEDITLKQTRAGNYFAMNDKGKVIAQGKDFSELLDNMSYVPKKIDRSFGPSEVVWTDKGVELTIGEKTLTLKRKEAFNFLSKFEDGTLLNQRRILKASTKGDLSILPTGKYRVSRADIDYAREFDSMVEARKYFETTQLTPKQLEEAATDKFLDFWVDGNKYVVQSDEMLYRVDTIDEVKKILKEHPDISNSVPDLVPLDPALEATMPQLMDVYKTKAWPRAGANKFNQPPEFALPERIHELSTLQSVTRVTDGFFSWLDSVAKKSGVKELNELSSDFQMAMRRTRVDHMNVVRYLQMHGKDEAGRILSPESWTKIYYHGAADAASLESVALGDMFKSRYGKELEALTKSEEAALSSIKDLYDSLGRKFGIDWNKLVYKYMPRLRAATESMTAEQLATLHTAKDFVQLIPEWAGNGLPKEIKFWAEMERTAELPQYWLKDNAFEVALLYSAQGHKKLYMNPLFQKANRLLQTENVAGQVLDPMIGHRFAEFQQDVMGSNQTNGEKFLADIGGRLFKGIKRSPLGKFIKMNEQEMEKQGKNILSNTMAMTYFSSMGWKPFLAIRNSVQPMTTLAMRIGPDWTMRAYSDVLEDPKFFYDKYRVRGILNEKPPIVNLALSNQTKIGKFAENSFMFFKNSDDVTRAVAYHSAELVYDNAVKMLRDVPGMTKSKFFEEAFLDRIPPNVAEKIWTLTQQGEQGMFAAKDALGYHLQNITMFDYSGASTPQMFRGVMGKLFGQFGTYSAGFRANIAEVLRYGTLKQKAMSIATYAAMSSALWGAFEALKIKTTDFVPFNPMVFTGGPGFDFAINVVKAMDTGFEGKQARAALARDYGSFVPGTSQAKYFGKAMNYVNNGQYYEALLSLSMAPVKKGP